MLCLVSTLHVQVHTILSIFLPPLFLSHHSAMFTFYLDNQPDKIEPCAPHLNWVGLIQLFHWKVSSLSDEQLCSVHHQ